MRGGPSLRGMEKRVRGERSREDYRQLPPRVTQDEMVPLHPVLHLLQDPREGTDDEWHIRMGAIV